MAEFVAAVIVRKSGRSSTPGHGALFRRSKLLDAPLSRWMTAENSRRLAILPERHHWIRWSAPSLLALQIHPSPSIVPTPIPQHPGPARSGRRAAVWLLAPVKTR